MNQRAISVTVLAALIPKCPLCVVGALATLGLGGVTPAAITYLNPSVLLVLSALTLSAVVAYFACWKGMTGAIVATIGCALILLSRRAWPSTLLLLAGTAIVLGYVLVDTRRVRSCCKR